MPITRPRPALLASALALVAAAAPLHAQSAEPAGPRRGSWGGEIMFPSARASLLRFVSPGAALVLSLDGVVGGSEREQRSVGQTQTEENDISGFELAIGLRQYTGDGALRPVRGFGAFVGRQSATNTSATSYGAYGEFGAHWFFTPHVSLGVIGDLRLTRRETEFESSLAEVEERTWLVALTGVRVGGAVYF